MKVLFLGSSVTFGSASSGWSMCEYLHEYCGIDVVKCAVSGTTLADIGDSSYVKRLMSIKGKYDNIDHFFCQLSTNDAAQNCEYGKKSDGFDKSYFDINTTLGAIEYIIATAKEEWGCPVSFYTNTKYDSEKYGDLVKELFSIKEKWNIGVLDLWNDPYINSISEADYNIYMSDKIHPSRTGYEKWWGPVFAKYLKI